MKEEMNIKKSSILYILFTLLLIVQTSPMKKNIKFELNEKFQELKITSQKNVKEICLEADNNKLYHFEEKRECLNYVQKIMEFLNKTDFSLFEDVQNVCQCWCPKKILIDPHDHIQYVKNFIKNCEKCKFTSHKFKNSRNQSINALKKIYFKDKPILKEEGFFSRTSKELMLQIFFSKKNEISFSKKNIYTFEETFIGTIECAALIRKIIDSLKENDALLFSDVYSACLCPCKKNFCSMCEKTNIKFATSKNKAIKKLKKISYKDTFIMNKKGQLSQDGRKLLLTTIEIFR